MVPRRRAQPRLEPVALPLSPERVPVRGPARGERPARQAGPGVRAAGHGRVRRRPLLDRRGALREGRPGDVLMSVQVTNAGPTPSPCTCCRPPGSATPGRGRRTRRGRSWADRRGVGRGAPPVPRRARAAGRRRARRRAADAAVLRERDQHRAPVRRRRRPAVPEGRHQRPRRARRDTVNPDRAGRKCAFWYQLDGRAGRDRRAAAAAASGGRPSRRPRWDRLRRRGRRRRRAEADEFYAELDPGGRLGRTRRW